MVGLLVSVHHLDERRGSVVCAGLVRSIQLLDRLVAYLGTSSIRTPRPARIALLAAWIRRKKSG